jgi:hypothetical protein
MQAMIRSTGGAELCATDANVSPRPKDCVEAYDETYNGRIDLSAEVVVGDPIETGPFSWRVPYYVDDIAGNEADTIWRDVRVDQVDIAEMESKVMADFQRIHESDIQKAVNKAVAEDRKKREGANQPVKETSCPKCNCDGNAGVAPNCEDYCDPRIRSCAVDEHGFVIRTLLWLEGCMPSYLASSLMGLSVLCFCLILLQWIFFLVSYAPVYNRNYSAYDEQRDRELRQAVNYFPNTTSGTPAATYKESPSQNSIFLNGDKPPRGSMSSGDNHNHRDIFSPGSLPNFSSLPHASSAQNGVSPSQQLRERERVQLADNVDDSPTSIITPSKRGDGVQRRSPYSSRVPLTRGPFY